MNNVSNINETSNSVKSMPLIAHSGAPVITTDMLADVYGTEVINIQVNHYRNKNRFIEGKHFYKLTGSILNEFKNWLTKCKLVYKGSEIISKHAKSIILWTERGAARHAKMLDTDNAWDVFEALEDFYFAKKEDAQQKISIRQSTAKELTPLRQTAERLIATGVGNIYPDIWKYVHKEFGVEHINELLPEQIPQAISYLDALEGEYIPKQESLPAPKFNKHKTIHTLEGSVIHIRAMKEYWNNGLKDSLKQLGYQHTGSMTEHMIDIIFHLDWVIHEIKGDSLERLPA
ncbi:hypothetical protein PROVALCAL_04082 [Providencia alcalifaciens DSM 30120]|uniref:KilA-N DNA-binding domain-containing protein n=1 Tax=Providencia alcalifaciens DSM 30120 TaxID=520999 RepID=B6XL20_9GAMM|nr:ORF6N domain-containing protein [Providencia alcalifaciens]EEB43916.1 hypothetical protein PROVALCAL_04082 [Providencia alcalifaciens DSM 30120]